MQADIAQDEQERYEAMKQAHLTASMSMQKVVSNGSTYHKDIEDKLQKIESSNSNSLRPLLADLENYLETNGCHKKLLEAENGLNRIIKLLDREERNNSEGTGMNFNNQIEILRLLKGLSDKASSTYIQAVGNCPHYVRSIMKNFHPININISAHVIHLLQTYIWKSEDESDQAFLALKKWNDGYGVEVWPFQIFT